MNIPDTSFRKISGMTIRGLVDEEGIHQKVFVSSEEILHYGDYTSRDMFFSFALQYLNCEGYEEDGYAKIDEVFYD